MPLNDLLLSYNSTQKIRSHAGDTRGDPNPNHHSLSSPSPAAPPPEQATGMAVRHAMRAVAGLFFTVEVGRGRAHMRHSGMW